MAQGKIILSYCVLNQLKGGKAK